MPGDVTKAILSLNGLSVGDAFGECFFRPANLSRIPEKSLPDGTWHWTDDTAMAICIVEVLIECQIIDQDQLAQSFANRFSQEPHRGYGRGAIDLLSAISAGMNWQDVSPKLFGSGSYGNGAAMRIAPLGGYYSGDIQTAVQEARRSAEVTHYHAEGIAGAIAVAVAAAAVSRQRQRRDRFLDFVASYTPDSDVKRRIQLAATIDPDDMYAAISELGTGLEISAQDTVPFCIWCAANNLHDFESALWQTASGGGDVDTTCAIVGGIVSLSTGEIPDRFFTRREPLPPIAGYHSALQGTRP